MLSRRALLATSGLAAPALLSFSSRAQTILPDKALRIILGYSAGGGTDNMVRAVAPYLERRIGRHITVENKPGNSGVAAAESLKIGPKDGSVVAFMPSVVLSLSVASAAAGFNAEADFAPLTVTGSFRTAIAVSPQSGVRALDEYLPWAKDDPRRRRMGVPIHESLLQVYGKAMGRELGIAFETVSYRGSAPMVNDLMVDRVSIAVAGLPAFLEYHRGNRLRVLAISGDRRYDDAKNIPTAAELGHPNLLTSEWQAYYISSSVPAPIQAEWARQLHFAIAEREITAKLVQSGLEVENSTQEVAVARMAAHIKLWRDRMESAGLKPVN